MTSKRIRSDDFHIRHRIMPNITRKQVRRNDKGRSRDERIR